MNSTRGRSSVLSRIAALTLVAGMAAVTARAEDIDIYAGANTEAMLPNVLFFLDNTSNWSASNQAWSASSVWANEKTRATTTCTISTSTGQKVLDQSCYDKAVALAQVLVESIFYYGIPVSSVTGGKKRPWESGFVPSKDDVGLKQGQVELRMLRLVVTNNVCTATAGLKVKIGFMLFDDAGSVRSNGDRPGYIRRAVKMLTTTPKADGSGSTCDEVINDLTRIDANITQPEFKGPANADYGSALFEAFKYFGGYTYPGNTSGASPVGAMGYGPVRFSNQNGLDDPDAFVDTGKTTYKSPIDLAGCSRSFIVLVGNGYPNAEPYGPPSFQGLGYTPPTITALPNDPSRYADEWTQFLNNTDVSPATNKQGISTYAINVYKDQPSAAQAALLKSMAREGGGDYIEVGGNLSDLFGSFTDLLIKMAAVDSVFTATTLPVSTTTQGTYLNQLFIGMFRPDGDGKPRWVGNVKQYKLALQSSGDVQVVDSLSKPALAAGTGFFSPLAVSYWSTDSVFFANNMMGTPESASDSPDGQIVEKGGVAQRLREANLSGASGRSMYTLPSPAPSSGTPLSDWPFTASKLGTGTFTTEEFSWIRGENNMTKDPGKEYNGAVKDPATGKPIDLGITGPRPSIHGDVLHSRPVAVNYGNGRVVVYYGSNDGTLRAVDGSQTGTSAGQELWSFIAPEHYAMLHRQRNDDPALYLPSTDSSGNPAGQIDGTQKKDYAFDGPIGLFARYSATTGSMIEGTIFAAMRRGGRALYAFDILDPAAPKFLWKISNQTSGFDKLAQTWSMPRPVIFPPAYSKDPFIIMGGGYDPAEDTNSTAGIGNRIYVVNARTGARLASLATDY